MATLTKKTLRKRAKRAPKKISKKAIEIKKTPIKHGAWVVGTDVYNGDCEFAEGRIVIKDKEYFLATSEGDDSYSIDKIDYDSGEDVDKDNFGYQYRYRLSMSLDKSRIVYCDGDIEDLEVVSKQKHDKLRDNPPYIEAFGYKVRKRGSRLIFGCGSVVVEQSKIAALYKELDTIPKFSKDAQECLDIAEGEGFDRADIQDYHMEELKALSKL